MGDSAAEVLCFGFFEMGYESAGGRMAFGVSGGLLSKATRFWKTGFVASRDGLPLLLGSPLSPEECVFHFFTLVVALLGLGFEFFMLCGDTFVLALNQSITMECQFFV